MNINLNIMRPKGFHNNVNLSLQKCIRRVKNGSGWKKVKKCPVCSYKKKILWLTKYKITISKCLRCDTGYTDKIPRNINDVYDNEQQFKHHQSAYEKNRKYRIKRFGTERVNLLRRFKKKGKLIDIGCGNGWFLEAAKKNYKCHGLELNQYLAEFTKKKLKINIFQKFKELEKNYYDIITLFDVIEHVENPTSLIKTLSSKLKKDGIILIYTPNKNSVGFNYMQENQNLVIPPYHLTYFSSNTFKFFPKNLKLVYEKTFGLDIGDIFSYERDKKNIKLSENLKKNFQKTQSIIDQLNLGNHIRVILKKKY